MEYTPLYNIAAIAFAPSTSVFPPHQMHQYPTHSRLHVRDVRDALILLEAVRLGILKQVSRRLNDAERNMYVRSGSVFIWEENDDDAGIKRWTDGCMWSQSRMREPFLFYEEKLLDDRIATAKGRSNSVGESSTSVVGPLTSAPRSTPGYNSTGSCHASGLQFGGTGIASIPEGSSYGPGLVKQAYSAYVTQPGTSLRQKFHLTAYFTYADLPNLPTLESEPRLWSIVIPQGVYRSGKSRTSARNLANAAEPTRTRQQTGDSTPSPMSSPSSIGHSPTLQWSGARRGSGSCFDRDGPSSPGDYHLAGGHHNPHVGGPSSQLLPSPRIGSTIPGNYTSIAGLPPVASLDLDTDGPRWNRNSEDDRVINMLNSRPIP